MAVYDLIGKFTQPSMWLSEQVWAQWALLAITALSAFVFLVLLTRRRREALTGISLADLPRVRLELDGEKLGRDGIDDSTVGGETQPDASKQNWAHKIAQAKWADTPIRLLRREIIKRDRAEDRLERELEALRAVNEQLRKRIAESNAMSEHLKYKLAELTEAKKQSRAQALKSRQTSQQQKDPNQNDPPKAVAETEHKQCRKCKLQKPRSEFHKNASSSDGLARWCKVCKTKSAKESRKRAASARSNSRQPSGICADAPLCVLHHRQADRLKRARRSRPHIVEQSGARAHKFRSPMSSPGLHCPKK